MAAVFSKISAMLDAKVDDILLKSAEAIANDARANAPTERIKSHIEISPIQQTPEGKQIRIEVSLDEKDGAPEARAYELGSGIHSTSNTVSPNQQGPGGKISIDKVNAPNLVFFWEKMDRWFIGPHVDHPGVEAKPYLFPAGRKNTEKIRKMALDMLGRIVQVTFTEGFK